jgi:hypothetical protein
VVTRHLRRCLLVRLLLLLLCCPGHMAPAASTHSCPVGINLVAAQHWAVHCLLAPHALFEYTVLRLLLDCCTATSEWNRHHHQGCIEPQ